MRAVYLFSNFDREEGFTPEIGECIKRDINEFDSLVFLASSPEGYVKTEFYFNVNKKWFDRHDISFHEYHLIDNRINCNDALNYINKASCIFLMGGTTREQIKFIRENGYIDSIRNSSAVIMGISAGAINLGIKSLSLKHADDKETIVYDGIGLTKKMVHPHFSLKDSAVMNELKAVSKMHPVYGICDNGAIIEMDGRTIIAGDVYFIPQSDRFTLTDIQKVCAGIHQEC